MQAIQARGAIAECEYRRSQKAGAAGGETGGGGVVGSSGVEAVVAVPCWSASLVDVLGLEDAESLSSGTSVRKTGGQDAGSRAGDE